MIPCIVALYKLLELLAYCPECDPNLHGFAFDLSTLWIFGYAIAVISNTNAD